MEDTALIDGINQEMGIALPPDSTLDSIRLLLQGAIGKLIANDFQQLVYVLYRVDVNERKLKYLLQENVGEDAAVIIADLIIERQLEKIKSRQQYRESDDWSDEEKW